MSIVHSPIGRHWIPSSFDFQEQQHDEHLHTRLCVYISFQVFFLSNHSLHNHLRPPPQYPPSFFCLPRGYQCRKQLFSFPAGGSPMRWGGDDIAFWRRRARQGPKLGTMCGWEGITPLDQWRTETRGLVWENKNPDRGS